MNETYRPLYHFSPPSGWMNDPNGLIFFDDEWHLFYQHIPEGQTRQHWGHAVSPDLVHWEHLPIALPPDDLGAIWSGSCVADERDTSGFFDGGRAGLVAVFTHQDNKLGQRQSLAHSRDRGRTWAKFENNPVLSSDIPDFRDPKVFWHAPTARWIMVLATGDHATFYTSPDLRAWTHASSFRAPGLPAGLVWECPDLFEMAVENDPAQTRWVLNASFLFGDNAGNGLERCAMRHFIGTFDGVTFRPDDENMATPTNFGPDDYAAITWADAPGARRILLGWMGHWAYAGKVPTSGWKGLMTVPRELTLRADESGALRLAQAPVPELRALRQAPRTWTNETTRSQTRQLAEQTGEAFEIEAEIQLGTARETGLRLRAGNGHHTTVGYNADTRTLFVDRTRSGETGFHPHFADRYQAPLALPSGGTLRLHLFADRCSLEVFADDGHVVLNTLIFPDPQNQALEFYAHDGDATLGALTLYPLNAV